MYDVLTETHEIDRPPREFLESIGSIFQVFGPETQDSGNVSYGVDSAGFRFFAKTTDPDASVMLNHEERLKLLRNAVRVANSLDSIAIAALNQIFELHVDLADAGWVAVDFYDGCLIYDFSQKGLHVVDLDGYHQGPFRNSMGRMFGSSRFMAPEEFAYGNLIDERTTVFTMGRTAAVLLSDGSLNR